MAVLALAACGQKGPLYLPDRQRTAVIRPSAAESARTAEYASAPAAPPGAGTLRFKAVDKPTPCPEGEHPQHGCLLVTGTNMDPSSPWTGFSRTAYLDGPTPAVPAGCIAVTTKGVLSSRAGAAHFTADGYYCPKTDTAVYRYTLEPANAQRFPVPAQGAIRYDGASSTETYAD